MKLRPNPILHVALDFGHAEIKVGRMAQQRHEVFFEFDAGFLGQGLNISPIRLPLKAGVQATPFRPFEGLFGVFSDSLPDGWGRLLLDRALTVRGIAPQSLTSLDRLAYVGRRGMGGLVYYPEIDLEDRYSQELELDRLAEEMNAVMEGEASDLLDELYRLGGSSAGARPKILAGFDPQTGRIIHGEQSLPTGFEGWLIKFPSSHDQKDIANVEFAYSLMARAAGVEMTETHLFPGKKGRTYFGIKRFDQEGNRRFHMHTATGLLHSDHRIPALDYEQLMQLALHLNRDFREAEKLFRLAIFNVFARNRDDHGKNFSFLMDDKGSWRFAPAYDLTFSSGPGGEHSTTVLGEGRQPGGQQLLPLGEKFSIKERKNIIDEVRDAVQHWPEFAASAGVSNASAKLIGKAIMA